MTRGFSQTTCAFTSVSPLAPPSRTSVMLSGL